MDKIFISTKELSEIMGISLGHAMKKACEKAGIKKIRIHDLRHPYVKHTTKNNILESRKAKLPM